MAANSPLPTTASEWNSLLRRSSPELALSLYTRSMLYSSSCPNKFTFTFLFRSFSSLSLHQVRLLHAHSTLFGFSSDPFLVSSLISLYARLNDLVSSRLLYNCNNNNNKDSVVRTAMVSAYARCGKTESALDTFHEIPFPTPVSYAALLSALSSSGRYSDVFRLFSSMRTKSMPVTEGALVSVLSSAARFPSLALGLQAHHCVVTMGRGGGNLSPALGTALLEMYSRCGRVSEARQVFNAMPCRDQPAWAAMIASLASNGDAHGALLLFEKMVELAFDPDHITWVIVLHACSHAGLVEYALQLFDKMLMQYGKMASAEHYGCLADALGKVGWVEKAWEFVRGMPMKPDERVLKCLLSACCEHRFVDGAEWAMKELMAIDAGNASSYVLLSNLYAGLEWWDDVVWVRKLMRVRGVPKAPGSSAV